MSLSKRMKVWPLVIHPDGSTMCNILKCGNPHFLKEFKAIGYVHFDMFKIALLQHIRKYHS